MQWAHPWLNEVLLPFKVLSEELIWDLEEKVIGLTSHQPVNYDKISALSKVEMFPNGFKYFTSSLYQSSNHVPSEIKAAVQGC